MVTFALFVTVNSSVWKIKNKIVRCRPASTDKNGQIFCHFQVWLKCFRGRGCKAAPMHQKEPLQFNECFSISSPSLNQPHEIRRIWRNSQKRDQIILEAPWNVFNITSKYEIGYVTTMTDQFPLCVFLRCLSCGPPVEWTVETFLFCKQQYYFILFCRFSRFSN